MSYTLKGTYKLGNTLTGWGGIYLNADVTFKSGDGVVYNSIRVDDGPGNMYYDSTVVVDLDDSTWYDEKLKTIIFEKATPVDEWLYHFIMLNSVKTIRGEWKFKDIIDYDHNNTNTNFTYNVNFTAQDGSSWKGMQADGNAYALYYIKENGSTVMALGNNDWTNESLADKGLQTVDFGDTPQEVDGSFYNWFTTWAVQQELNSTYYFNETLTTGEYEDYHGQDDTAEAVFYIGDEGFTALIADSGGYLEYRKADGEEITVYDYNDNKWVDEKYRKITFIENTKVSSWWLKYILKNSVVVTEEQDHATVSVFMGNQHICTFKEGVAIVLKCKDMVMPGDITIRVDDPDPIIPVYAGELATE